MALQPADRARRSTGSPPATAPSHSSSRRTRWPSGPATTSARRPSCSTRPTRSPPPSSARASTRTSPATPRSPGGSSPPRSWPGSRSSSAPTRSRPPRTSSTSSPSRSTSASSPSRPRTRSPGPARPSARRFGGALGVTTTSGPGIDLKSETIGLAVSLELPLVIVDVQRGGPSTGLPTKTEQADLLLAMYGRHGEAPLPIVAPRPRVDCFAAAIEAARIALKYRTPVFLLSDGYLANGSEPWRVPDLAELPAIGRRVRHEPEPRRRRRDGVVLALRAGPGDARPPLGRAGHARASSTASGASRRPTAPATSPTTRTTTSGWSTCAPHKVAGIADGHPAVEVDDPDGGGAPRPRLGLDLRGGDRGGEADPRPRACSVAQAHLRHLNPLPAEPRRGARPLPPGARPRDQPRPARRAHPGASSSSTPSRSRRMQGLPFRIAEIERAITDLLGAWRQRRRGHR